MRRRLRAAIELLRPRQWVKNAFVLAPLFFGFRLGDPEAGGRALLAIVVFCLVSSAVYIFNDLRDMAADFAHPKKRYRPLASGTLRPATGVVMILALLAGAALLWRLGNLGSAFALTALIYMAINLAYSIGLKHIALLEMFMVASGYVLRVIAGCAAVDVAPSQWLLSTTGVVALLLVTGKRRAEIAEELDLDCNRQSLRSYNVAFLDSMLAMLGSITIITYLMFTVSDYASERYGSRYLMLSATFVAYGVFRYVQVVKTGTGADSPTELVTKDTGIGAALLLWGLFMGGLLYL